MEKAVVIPLIVQGLFTLLLLFRSELALWLRLLVFAVSAAFIVVYYPEIYAGIQQISTGVFLPTLKSTLASLLPALLWLWPLALLVSFYVSQERDAVVVLSVLLGITVIAFAGYLFAGIGVS